MSGGPTISPSTTDEMTEELRRIVREELDRARAEAQDELWQVGKAVAGLYAASLLLYLAVVFLTLMVVYILGALIEPWIGAAIVGSVLLVTASIAFARAVRRAERALGRR